MTLSTTTAQRTTKVDAFEVGWLFVQEYYTFLNKEPQRLHCFYNKKSSFLHGHEGEDLKVCVGQTDIHSRILELDFQDCKVLVSNVDSQASLNGGIIVQVLGEMSNKGGACHKFAQTFFLAEQPNGYYVLNDIFRFLKEDIDNDYDDEQEDPSSVVVPDEQQLFSHPPGYAPLADCTVPSISKQQHAIAPSSLVAPLNGSIPASPLKAKQAFIEPNSAFSPEQKQSAQPVQSVPAVEPPQETQEKAASEKSTVDTGLSASTPQKPPQNAPAKKPENASTTTAGETSQASTKASWATMASRLPEGYTNGNVQPGKTVSTPPKPQGQIANGVAASKESSLTLKYQQQKKDSSGVKGSELNGQAPDAKDGFREVSTRQRRNNGEEKEKLSVYIRQLPEGVTRQDLLDLYSTIGQVRHIDIPNGKHMAFVEFTSAETAAKAIEQTFTIGNNKIVAEERRKQNGGSGRGGQRGSNGSSSNNQRSGGGRSGRNFRNGRGQNQQEKEQLK